MADIVKITDSILIDDKKDLSVFSMGNLASLDEIKNAVKKLQICFPKTEPAFFSILVERILKNSWTSSRLNFAINYVIDNHHYNFINIADIIDVDKKIRLLTYNQLYSITHCIPHPDYVKILPDNLYIDKQLCKMYRIYMYRDVIYYTKNSDGKIEAHKYIYNR